MEDFKVARKYLRISPKYFLILTKIKIWQKGKENILWRK
jgi:hypothetical protein